MGRGQKPRQPAQARLELRESQRGIPRPALRFGAGQNREWGAALAGHWVGDLLILTVAHTVREEKADGTLVDVFRIISARPATRKERRRYEDENG